MLLLAVEVFAFSFSASFSLRIFGLLTVGLLPRLLNLLVKKDTTYVLFGFHYYVHGMISAISNSRAYTLLFGDSSLIVHYLRFIGYRLNRIVQTGSNFGLAQLHDDPFLCSIGSGTMVSDELAMLNAPMSNSSFVLREVAIGDNNYLGNCINYPSRRQDRRQLPARDQGHGADRRAGARERRAPRIALLRDPAHRRQRHALKIRDQRRGAARSRCPRRRATTWRPWSATS